MNELTQETLVEVLSWVKEAKELMVEQAPLLAQEIISYGITANILAIGLAALATGGAIMCTWLLCKHGEKWWEEDNVRIVPCGVVIFFGFLLGTPHLFIHIFILVKVLVSPRLYVLEKLSEMISK